MSGLYDLFNRYSLLIVLIIVLVIWGGIYWYLHHLGKRIRRLEEAGKK